MSVGLGQGVSLADPLLPSQGGLGLSSLTAHYLIVGNGTAAVTLLAPGTTGLALLSAGAAADPAYGLLLGAGGGTGVVNTGKTITLAGSLATSGAFDVTLTATATTNVTLPASGILGIAQSLQGASPATGATVNITSGRNVYMVLTPAGTIATLLLNLPNSGQVDGDLCTVCSSQIITAVTLGAGALTMVGAITTLALGGFAQFVYRASGTTWFRCG